jgi:hypothetical protein
MRLVKRFARTRQAASRNGGQMAAGMIEKERARETPAMGSR